MHRHHMKCIAWILVWSIFIGWVWLFFERHFWNCFCIVEMMIARKSILRKSKLSSGASLLSTTPWRHTKLSKMTAKTSCGPWSRSSNWYTTTWRTLNSFVTNDHIQVYGAPVRFPIKKWPWVATSPVAFENKPTKATRSICAAHTTRSVCGAHSRIICGEILEEKISIQSPHRSQARHNKEAAA